MRNYWQYFVFNLFFSAFVAGVASEARAQGAVLPPLPSIPSASTNQGVLPKAAGVNALPEVSLPELPKINNALPPVAAAAPANGASPAVELPALPAIHAGTGVAGNQVEQPEVVGASAANAPADGQKMAGDVSLPPLPDVNKSSPVSETDKPSDMAGLPTADPLPALPGMDGVPPLPGDSVAVLPPGDNSTDESGAVPEMMPVIKVVKEAPPLKSWQTPLIKQVHYPTTTFNYKRQVLPIQISRASYDVANQHLPRRMVRDDYSALLFSTIARRDLDATRALLNAGTSLSAKNAYGETPLAFARRTGAVTVAALLEARGARD